MTKTLKLCLGAIILLTSLNSCKNSIKKIPNTDSTAQQTTSQTEVPATNQGLISDKAFDFTNIPESKENIGVFPFVSDLPEYEHNKSVSNETINTDFDKRYFFDGKQLRPLEGKMHFRRRLIETGKEFSAYKVQKSFEDMFTKMGAVKIYAGEDYRDSLNKYIDKIPDSERKFLLSAGTHGIIEYALKKGNSNILFFVSIDGNYNGYYDICVMQQGELNQTLSLITANEMKKELDAKGSVTLYINFDTDRATVKSDSDPIVNEIYTLLKDNADLKISINGYTDNTGAPEHNLQLSEARAKTVADVLVKKGITSNRIQVKGFGQNDPIADNRTEDGKAKNRRVEIVKIK